MKRSVLIIDDEKDQAENVCKALSRNLDNTFVDCAWEEKEIFSKVENNYYSVAVVDLRMDGFSTDGIEIIKKIIEINPFARIIIVSAFIGEYGKKIFDLTTTGRILDVVEKCDFKEFVEKLKAIIEKYHSDLFQKYSEVNSALLEFYSQAKNEENPVVKGEKFEHFVSLLFQSIGFSNISKRVRDQSMNEIDLIIRNEIDDSFLNKFGKYILVECKNKPNDPVDKNTFIVFERKLSNTNGLAELGILATTGYFAKTAYKEAIRDSGGREKIIFLSNNEFEKLIDSSNRLDTFKKIIDSQVKDN